MIDIWKLHVINSSLLHRAECWYINAINHLFHHTGHEGLNPFETFTIAKVFVIIIELPFFMIQRMKYGNGNNKFSDLLLVPLSRTALLCKWMQTIRYIYSFRFIELFFCSWIVPVLRYVLWVLWLRCSVDLNLCLYAHTNMPIYIYSFV